jgi:hypothetical protein
MRRYRGFSPAKVEQWLAISLPILLAQPRIEETSRVALVAR